MPTIVPTMEVAATEEPTEAPTVAIPTEVPPTEVPATATATEIPPTEVPTEIPTEAPTEVPPTPLPSPTLDTVAFPYSIQYVVQRGDTVAKLAERFGSSVEAIIIANQLNANAYIVEAHTLIIPVPTPPEPTEAPTEAPIIVEPAPTEVPAQAAEPTPIVYIVRYGDSLSSIAARFGLRTVDLARYNDIVNPNLVYYGQILHIPVGGVPTPVPPTPVPPTSPPPQQLYRVMPGDNLYRISIRFNVSLSDLIEVNGIADPTRIYVGQILIIP